MTTPISYPVQYTQGSYNILEDIEESSSLNDALSCSSDSDMSLLEDDDLICSNAYEDVARHFNMDTIVSVMH